MGISRRGLFRAGTAAAGGAVLVGYQSAAHAADAPPSLPQGIRPYRELYKNWDGAIVAAELWSYDVRNAQEVVTLANWAHANGWTIRARGYRHGWSPLTVAEGTPATAKVLLLNTTKHMDSCYMHGTTVVAQAGISMNSLVRHIADRKRGFTNMPAPGDVTVAGVLAVNGHGTALPARGEKRQQGATYGSLSNTVHALTAVVWDAASGKYTLKTFQRTDPEIGPFLTSMGRAFLTEVQLQTNPMEHYRCRTWTHISVRDLFAAPEKAGYWSLSSMIDRVGRVGLIWYTFTDKPWIQQWEVARRRPFVSRPTITPYNFPFADRLPSPVPELLGQVVAGNQHIAPAFGKAVYATTATSLTTTLARDMWGPAHHFQHFVKPTTLRVSAGSHVLLTSRDQLQRVVHEFTEFFSAKLKEYQDRGEFPINSCMELRITGIDDPGEVDMEGAVTPSLSGIAPVPGRPELDTAVWLDVLTLPGTPGQEKFFQELEHFIGLELTRYGVARPEWAKRFAHTERGAWTGEYQLKELIPSLAPGWDHARATFHKYDPHRIFTAPLHDAMGI